MLRLIIRRLIGMVPLLLIIVTLTFLLLRLAPGSPFTTERSFPAPVLKALNEQYGLDKPIHVQYFNYLKELLKGNLGPSTRYIGKTVNEIIWEHLPNSVLTHPLVIGEGRKQLAVLGVQEVTEDVQLHTTGSGGSEFTSGNELDLNRLASFRHRSATFNGVVIGESDRLELMSGRFAGELLGRVSAVGEPRVQMEISVHVVANRGVTENQGVMIPTRELRMRSPRIRSRIPFTNLPDS